MKLVELIRRDMIVAELHATGKRALLAELAAHVAQAHPSLEVEAVTRVLADREALASTALGEGVAIPHGKLGALDELVACLGRATAGVEFDAIDHQPTFLFFVLLAPEGSTGAHLKALARISRVFKDADFRRRIIAAPDADAMYQVLEAEDAKY